MFFIKFRDLEDEITPSFCISYNFIVKEKKLDELLTRMERIEEEINRIFHFVYKGERAAYFLYMFEDPSKKCYQIILSMPQSLP